MLYIVSFLILALSLLINNAAASLFLGIFLAIFFKIPEKFYTKKMILIPLQIMKMIILIVTIN